MSDKHTLRFSGFLIPADVDVLFRDDEAIPIEPQAVRVLRYLAERPGRVVTKEELLDRVWPDVFTTDGVLKKAVSQIRKALGDSTSQPQFVETHHGRGYRFIAAVDAEADKTVDTAQMGSFERPIGNLPFHISDFIGRERELAELQTLIGATRILTITGPGGMGKTRLSQELAWSITKQFPGGLWFIELGELADPATIAEAIAAPFELQPKSGSTPLSILQSALRDAQALLVLDNCEHVVEECARIASLLLRSSSLLKIVATSRESLNITGETIWRIPPMSERDALSLLEARARLAVPSFSLSAASVPAAAALCERLEGNPLAIELASARMRVMTVDELTARIDDQLNLLSRSSQAEPARHRTLRSTIAWSYSLLTEPERALLRRLSVFTGGWVLDAAEAVASDRFRAARGAARDAEFESRNSVLDLMGLLVDKSLVVADTSKAIARYSLLESIRRFAREQLQAHDEEAEAIARHRAWALAFAEQAEAGLGGPNHGIWLERVLLDHANLRSAWQGAASDRDVQACARFLNALRVYVSVRNIWTELSPCIDLALANLDSLDPELRADTLFAIASFAMRRGEIDASVRHAKAALALRREQDPNVDAGRTLRLLSAALAERGDLDEAERLIEESLVIFRAHDEQSWIARATGSRAYIAMLRNDLDEAAQRYETHIALSQKAALPRQVAIGLHNLADILWQKGDVERAAQVMEDALAAARALNEQLLAGRSLHLLGCMTGKLGDAERSLGYLREATTLLRLFEDNTNLTLTIESAAVSLTEIDPVRSVQLAQAAASIREALGIEVEAWQRVGFDERLDAARDALTAEQCAAARDKGAKMTMDDALALAFGLE